MAPEMVKANSTFGGRIKVWSLGIVLFAFLFNCVPYPGKTRYDVKSSIEKTNDENINIKINRVYNKLSDHLVKKIRLASNNGRDKKALEVIKKIFNEE